MRSCARGSAISSSPGAEADLFESQAKPGRCQGLQRARCPPNPASGKAAPVFSAQQRLVVKHHNDMLQCNHMMSCQIRLLGKHRKPTMCFNDMGKAYIHSVHNRLPVDTLRSGAAARKIFRQMTGPNRNAPGQQAARVRQRTRRHVCRACRCRLMPSASPGNRNQLVSTPLSDSVCHLMLDSKIHDLSLELHQLESGEGEH